MMPLPFPAVEEPDDAARELGRKLFAGETQFVKGVVAMDGLPPPIGWRSALPGGPTWANPA